MMQLRPAQQEILQYRAGTMGISAVPGSGKTWTLSQVAASLVVGGGLQGRQEVLIVTFANSAVDNFRVRIGDFLEPLGRLRSLGYRVRTLHSLAREIVSQAAHIVGVADDFSVVDSRLSETMLKSAFRASFLRHREELLTYLSDSIFEFKRAEVERQQLPLLLEQVTRNAISHLKNRQCSPADIRSQLTSESPPLAQLTVDVYERYEQALSTRGGLDFDDLTLYAMRALSSEQELVEILRARWPFILEDEAQDSSPLQEQILRCLVGDQGNWVRVGDPNQAIYETFTAAHPKYLRAFLEEADVRRDLPNSGRSGRPIIELANELIRWSCEQHPVAAVRSGLSQPYIKPTPDGDPQPNPANDVCLVRFEFDNDTPESELDRAIASLQEWLPEHEEETVAILVPSNARGAQVVKALFDRQIPYTDALMRVTTATRQAAGALAYVLKHLARPDDANGLHAVYRVWYSRVLGEAESDEGRSQLEEHLELLGEWMHNEDLVWPQPGTSAGNELSATANSYFERFRRQMQQWHELVLLPIGELLTAVAQDLFDEQEKLAMTHLFAEILQQRSQYNIGDERRLSTLDELAAELVVVAKDERKMRSIEADSTGFDPEEHRGEVAVATVHGAKGLEWDRVYLLSVSNYDFPSGSEDEFTPAQKWFVRGRLDLQAETLAQLDIAVDESGEYEEGRATASARLDYVRERLRLFYVGITRARKELLVGSNIGPYNKNRPAESFLALQSYLTGGRGD
jgi:DNA helicase-2/ATP-dependent DNA helicase PcrA